MKIAERKIKLYYSGLIELEPEEIHLLGEIEEAVHFLLNDYTVYHSDYKLEMYVNKIDEKRLNLDSYAYIRDIKEDIVLIECVYESGKKDTNLFIDENLNDLLVNLFERYKMPSKYLLYNLIKKNKNIDFLVCYTKPSGDEDS